MLVLLNDTKFTTKLNEKFTWQQNRTSSLGIHCSLQDCKDKEVDSNSPNLTSWQVFLITYITTDSWIVNFIYMWFGRLANYDCLGECSSENDCLGWHWLTFRQPERKSSSESSELWIISRCFKSLVVFLIIRRSRDVIGRLSVNPWCYWLWRL